MQLSTLSVLLAAQLGLAGYLWLSNNQQTAPAPLLAQAEITRLTLTQGPRKAGSNSTAPTSTAADGKPAASNSAPTLTLQQQDGQWRLNAGSNEQPLWLAASAVKLQPILTDLQKARLHWPLTDSKDSLQRFTLADDAFQWRLQLANAGGQQQTLWLGDSAGFRQQYLRRDGENAVYKIALNSYELSTDPNQWLDKTLLAVKDIQAVRGADFALSKKTGSTAPADWQLSGLLPAALPDPLPAQNTADQLNQRAVEQLLTNLQTLTVQQYQPKAATAATSWQQAAQLTISSADQAGRIQDVSLQLLKAGEQYLVRRSDIAAVFSLDQTQYDNLASTSLARLQQPAGGALASAADGQTTSQAVAGQPVSGNSAVKALQQLKAGQTARVAPAAAPAASQPQDQNSRPD